MDDATAETPETSLDQPVGDDHAPALRPALWPVRTVVIASVAAVALGAGGGAALAAVAGQSDGSGSGLRGPGGMTFQQQGGQTKQFGQPGIPTNPFGSRQSPQQAPGSGLQPFGNDLPGTTEGDDESADSTT